MKAIFRAVTIAAAMSLPVALQAQPIDPTVQVNITNHIRPTGGTNYSGTGGGFLSNFVVNFSATETATLNNWLVWCIDPTRLVGIPSSNNYALYTLAGFDAANLSTSGHFVTTGELEEIALMASQLEDSWGTLTATDKANRQGGIWDNFTGATTSGYNPTPDPAFDASNWYVLWNGQTQTFITRIPERFIVPEPSAIALMGFGLVSLVAVRRRRSA